MLLFMMCLDPLLMGRSLAGPCFLRLLPDDNTFDGRGVVVVRCLGLLGLILFLRDAGNAPLVEFANQLHPGDVSGLRVGLLGGGLGEDAGGAAGPRVMDLGRLLEVPQHLLPRDVHGLRVVHDAAGSAGP